MPRFDGTGPNGQGPLTGRGAGNCTNVVAPGFRRGFGRGRGLARRGEFIQVPPRAMPSNMTETEEKQYLEEELEALKQEMKEIEKRLKELN
ncbi:MAG: DUF5320 domain-containing protein [Nanoarchaeota archaeon]|nr:DUF5320 domain-containing protein [Nanoarchaeota archaeon]MBU0977691.1 DUF5320 domain-containing protein [Nanoarchaeota archaeon]